MTDLDLRGGQIHRGLGVVARWPDIAMVVPSDAAHDAAVDQMFHGLGPEPEAAQIVTAVNQLLASGQLRAVAMVVEATGGPMAMAFGPVEVMVDGDVVLNGSDGGVRQQVPASATRLILRAAGLPKAAEPVAPYDLRRGVAPGAGLTLLTLGAVGPAKLDPETPSPPDPTPPESETPVDGEDDADTTDAADDEPGPSAADDQDQDQDQTEPPWGSPTADAPVADSPESSGPEVSDGDRPGHEASDREPSKASSASPIEATPSKVPPSALPPADFPPPQGDPHERAPTPSSSSSSGDDTDPGPTSDGQKGSGPSTPPAIGGPSAGLATKSVKPDVPAGGAGPGDGKAGRAQNPATATGGPAVAADEPGDTTGNPTPASARRGGATGGASGAADAPTDNAVGGSDAALMAAPAGVRSGRFPEGDEPEVAAERAAPAVQPSPLEVPFRSVVLIGSSQPTEVTPLPQTGDDLAPRTPGDIPAGRVQVQGIRCTRQHFNNPDAAHCMVCGLSLLHLTDNLVTGLRPTLGFIVFDDGSAYGLDRSYVIGREPRPADGSSAQMLVLRDNNETLSRTHATLRLDDWTVQLVDLGSTNGTYVWDQANERWNQLSPNSPTTLRSADTVALGRRTFVLESVSRS